MFLTKLLLNKEITDPNRSVPNSGENLQVLIKDHLMNISHKYTSKTDNQNVASTNEIRKDISSQGTMNQQILDII